MSEIRSSEFIQGAVTALPYDLDPRNEPDATIALLPQDRDTFGMEAILAVDNSAPEPGVERAGVLSRVRGFVSRNTGKLAVAATGVSIGTTVALDPFEETKNAVLEVAPWVIPGIGVSEALFVGGAAMMLGGVGDKIGNPLTVKSRLPEISERASGSRLFKTGFIVNTTGAVGDFAVLAPAVVAKLPLHSWGILSLALIDLGVTVSVRRAILSGIRKNTSTP